MIFLWVHEVRYHKEDGIRSTFSRVKLRSCAPHFFDNAVESLNAHYHEFDEEFNVFYLLEIFFTE